VGVLDPITQAPRPQKIIFGVFMLVVVAVLGYFLVIAPAGVERDSLWQQNEDLKTKLVQARADEANLRPFRAQAEALRARLDAARERLPNEKEIPTLYRQLTDIAFEAGLQVALFAPKPQEEREVVIEVPIQIVAETGYHQLGAFFDRVARLTRIVSLSDFRLVGIDRPTGTLRAEITLATYLFRPEGAPPPARPGAPPAPGTPPGKAPGAARAARSEAR
jgi:type IV pilus assembly protein PilO